MKNKAREAWVKKYYNDAVKATAGTGIFPETLLAQAIVESQRQNAQGIYEPGLSVNAKRANNYFGIKKYPKWKGRTIDLPTPQDAKKISTFVVYDSVLDSFAGYVRFLQVNKRYSKIFNAPNYSEQITRIALAGYAEKDYQEYANTLNQIATSIKNYAAQMKDFVQSSTTASNNTKKIFPLLFAGALVAVFLISKSLKK